MATTVISNNMPYTFGQMTNRLIGSLIQGNTQIRRLQDAIATASSGYTGAEGTEFEINNMMAGASNLFGVVANPDAPGEQGKAYSYAIGELHTAWLAFWQVAQPYVEQLDNGQVM